jgi:hypothetical protein
MLSQLRSEFFRAYLPPWVYVSDATVAVGVVLVLVGVALRPAEPRGLKPDRAAGIVVRIALVNAIVAAFLLAPILVPSFRFPILITQWPGIYMVLAYFSFLAVGVLGMAAWALILVHLPDLLNRTSLGGLGFAVTIIMTEVGIFGLTISMFLGGYVGSWLAYTGAGPVAVGAEMEFSVIPSAVSIYLVVAGTVVGVVNVFASGRSVQS